MVKGGGLHFPGSGAEDLVEPPLETGFRSPRQIPGLQVQPRLGDFLLPPTSHETPPGDTRWGWRFTPTVVRPIVSRTSSVPVRVHRGAPESLSISGKE